MLYLAFIFHMHQPYYKNLLTQESALPWVRLHGVKDYLDMVKILEKFPFIHQTFNLVPSLVEQIDDYNNGTVKDKFLEFSSKPAAALKKEEKEFILGNFFMINKERVIATFPRYYELYFKKEAGNDFNTQDYLDLQVWFNLAWIDPAFRQSIDSLSQVVKKARFFNEDDKRIVLDTQLQILKDTIPVYKEFIAQGQIEVTTSPYYHPILPLLYNTNIAKEANPKSVLPRPAFSYPSDAELQVREAVEFYKSRFGFLPQGMWPSEEAVSEHILPFIIASGIKWIVADEAILFRSLGKKKRDTQALYRPYVIKREEGDLNIIFRDRVLSDLLGFVYHRWETKDAVNDFMRHLENISKAFPGQDSLVAIAMDGENAWEYYPGDGHPFLELLYQRLSEAQFLKVTTVSEYLAAHPPKERIRRIAAGSWIYAEFSKWINNPHKNKAWEYLKKARQELEEVIRAGDGNKQELARRQMSILEGSDWFWWYGEDPSGDFDRLFRMHLSNFYAIIDRPSPEYLKEPF